MTAITHVMPASVFTKFVVGVFEAVAPGDNTFVLLGTDDALDKYTKGVSTNIIALNQDADPATIYADAVDGADAVIVHRMTLRSAGALHAASDGALRVWAGWGADYYGTDIDPLARQLAPLTARWQSGRSNLVRKVDRVRRRWWGRSILQNAARRANAFSAPIPDDVPIFRRRFPRFSGDIVQLNYESVEDTFSVGFDGELGPDILLGNSATITNNHFDVLERLARLDLDGRRVYVPLSYGDPELAREVITRGRSLLGDAFEPLEELLPYDEYKKLIARCGIVIMGHRRQQAVGNIGAALWNGAQVVLDELNPLSAFLTRGGAQLTPLSQLESQGLTGAQKHTVRETNRTVLRDFWGRERVLQNARDVIELAAARRRA